MSARHSAGSASAPALGPFLAMAGALTLVTDKATFDAFLRDTYGIEGNIYYYSG